MLGVVQPGGALVEGRAERRGVRPGPAADTARGFQHHAAQTVARARCAPRRCRRRRRRPRRHRPRPPPSSRLESHRFSRAGDDRHPPLPLQPAEVREGLADGEADLAHLLAARAGRARPRPRRRSAARGTPRPGCRAAPRGARRARPAGGAGRGRARRAKGAPARPRAGRGSGRWTEEVAERIGFRLAGVQADIGRDARQDLVGRDQQVALGAVEARHVRARGRRRSSPSTPRRRSAPARPLRSAWKERGSSPTARW